MKYCETCCDRCEVYARPGERFCARCRRANIRRLVAEGKIIRLGAWYGERHINRPREMWENTHETKYGIDH